MKLSKINEIIAEKATDWFGTMWCTYIFIVYGLLPLLIPAYIEKLLYWSNCVQLVALPLLMVGQNIKGRSAEQRSIDTHDTVMKELNELKTLHYELKLKLEK
jgi:hypothetical protein